MLVLGVTGKNCAGKDEMASYLEQEGFGRHSLSDAIREELRKEGMPLTRENLIAKGNQLRRENGPGVLAQKIKQLLVKDREVVVSIRNPTEVDELRKLDNFFLIGIDAPAELRWKREVARAREGGQHLTFEEFVAKEEKENSSDPTQQQLDTVLKMADEVIMNDETLPDLREATLEVLKKVTS